MSLKFTEELCLMTKKNDATFEEELTCRDSSTLSQVSNCDDVVLEI